MLVTAGPTREALDPVRYLTNHSSGKMGYAVAKAAARRGAEVTLVAGPTGLPDLRFARMVHVESAAGMFEAVSSRAAEQDIIEHFGNFDPDAPCTRAMAVEFMWKAAGAQAITMDTGFTDVPMDASYSIAVDWAVIEGITSGTDENTFSPDLACTRGQIVTFLHRAYA